MNEAKTEVGKNGEGARGSQRTIPRQLLFLLLVMALGALPTAVRAGDTAEVVEKYPGTDPVNPWALKRVRSADGTLTTWSYAWSGNNFVTTRRTTGSSAVDATSVTAGTQTVTKTNAAGKVFSEVVTDIASGAILDSAIALVYQVDAPFFPKMFKRLWGPNETYVYDGQGRIISHTDQLGKTTTTERDGLGRVTKITRSPLTTTIAYHPGHLGTKVTTQAAGEADRVVETTLTPFGESTIVAISGPENLTLTRTETPGPNGTITTLVDNATTKQRVQTVLAKSTLQTTYSQNATEPWTVQLTPNGAGWTQKTSLGAAGVLETLDLDGWGRPTRRATPSPAGGLAETTYAYTAGRLAAVTDPAGTTTYAYAPDGSPQKISRGDQSVAIARAGTAAKLEWTWTNALDQTLWKQTYQPGSATTGPIIEDLPWGKTEQMLTTALSINLGKRVAATTNAAGDLRRNVAWNEQRLDATLEQGARAVTFAAAATAFGEIASLTDIAGSQPANAVVTTFASGLPTRRMGIAGLAATSYPSPYRPDGSLVFTATRNGRSVTQTYSPKGDLLATGGYAEIDVAWSAPAIASTGITRELTTEAGRANYRWNLAGHLQQRGYADGKTETLARNASGQVTRLTTPNGFLSLTPNAAGWPEKISGSSGQLATGRVDGAGRPTILTDRAGSRTLTYLGASRQIDVENWTAGVLAGQSIDLDYDPQGNLAAVKPSAGPAITYTTTAGNLTSLTTAGGTTGTWSNFDPVTGQARRLVLGPLTTETAYDGYGRVTSRTHKVDGALVASYGYGYNADGQCHAVSTPDGPWTVGYGAAGWLATASRGGTTPKTLSYGFGESGAPAGASAYRPSARANAPGLTIQGSVTPGATVTINGTPLETSSTGTFSQTSTPAAGWQTYTIVGTLAGAGSNGAPARAEEIRRIFIPPASETLTSDAGGNRTGDARLNQGWNDFAQQVWAAEKAPPAGEPAKRVDVTRDTGGRVIERRESQGGTLTWRTVTLYDREMPLRDIAYNATGAETARHVYTWGPDLSGKVGGAGGTGGLLEIQFTQGGTTTRSLVMNDGLGSVIGMIDAVTGARVATYSYGPFGEPLTVTGERADLCRFRYQTKPWDAFTKTYDFPKRTYDPFTQTFESIDPKRERGDFPNGYWAFRNQPFNFYDPDGGKSVEQIGADLDRAQAEGVGPWLGAIPTALWDFMNPFDPESPATSGRHRFNHEILPEALANLDASSIPSPLKAMIEGSIGLGMAGNSLNPLNVGVDLYDLGSQLSAVGPWAVGKQMVDGIAARPAMFAGGLPVMIATGKILPRLQLSSIIQNPVPSNFIFARILKPVQIADILAGRNPFLSAFPGANEAFITTSQVLPIGLTRSELAILATIPEENVGGVMRFVLPNAKDIASPINRSIPGFIGKGRTIGDIPEFVIPNRRIGDFTYQLEIPK